MGYGCEQVEYVATPITATNADNEVGMSASVESSRDPHIPSGSPMVTPTRGIDGDDSNDRLYLEL